MINSIKMSIQNKNIKIHIDGKIGFVVDDGRGMTKKGLTGMFAVYSSHGHIHRIGNYGFGAKAAFANLGKNGITRVITKSSDGPTLTATADWKSTALGSTVVAVLARPVGGPRPPPYRCQSKSRYQFSSNRPDCSQSSAVN